MEYSNIFSMTDSTPNSVPTFVLYGETPTKVSKEYLHIETISNRSKPYDWHIGAHRHQGLFQLLFVFSGSVKVLLDCDTFEHPAPVAIVIPPGVVHGFTFTPETEGYVLTLDNEGLATMAEARADLPPLFAALHDDAMVLSLLPDSDHQEGSTALDRSARIRGLLEQISSEFQAPGMGSARLFVWLVHALLLLLVRAQQLRHTGASGSGRHANLFRRFQQLVDAHYTEHWSVPRYAEELRLTENRLNRLCRKETGESAFGLIQARLLLEARRRLIFTAVPVSQLAYELGFSDPAYFTRFFKKTCGIAPAAFRTQSGNT